MTSTYYTQSTGFLYRVLILSLAALTVFFLSYAFFAIGINPADTLGGALIAGGIAVWLATTWMPFYGMGNAIRWVIIAAFFLRVIVGVDLYLLSDPEYFLGSGAYIDFNREYYLTYENSLKASQHLLSGGDWRWFNLFNSGETKNPALHMWMGYFLSMTGSMNAMDLAVFNSFHHVIASILISAVAIHLNYSIRSAALTAATIAWLPWSFPASIMWRDEVGMALLAFAVILLAIGKKSNIVLSLLYLVFASWLVYHNRTVYAGVFLIVGILSAILRITHNYFREKFFLLLAIVFILTIIIIDVAFSTYQSVFFAAYKEEYGLDNFLQRIMNFPFLLLRAIFGPFPWFASGTTSQSAIEFRLFDYAYHVLQLAFLIVVASNWRAIFQKLDILILTFFGLWFVGIVAHGVHTAYLAVALPFIFPFVFEIAKNMKNYIFISSVFFLLANIIYVASGLAGRGLIIGITGY